MTTPLWKRIIARILEALLAIIFISRWSGSSLLVQPAGRFGQSKGWGVANYLTLFGYQEGLPKYLFNSIIVTLVAVVFSVVVCTLAGYSFSRFDYPAATSASWSPVDPDGTVRLAADPADGLVQADRPERQPAGRGPGHHPVPAAYEHVHHAQRVRRDPQGHGGGRHGRRLQQLQALFKILVPVVKPSMVTVGLLAFLEAWNNFMIPLYLSSSSKSTLPLAMVNMRQQTMGVIDYGATEAGVVILLIPCAILFLALQKYYVKGFMAGAVKADHERYNHFPVLEAASRPDRRIRHPLPVGRDERRDRHHGARRPSRNQLADNKSHAVANLKVAAGELDDEFHGMVFQDSDVYKWLEEAAYALAYHPDPELKALCDRTVDLIARAQQSDGYLDTPYQIKSGVWADRPRFSLIQQSHEMYVMGHYIEPPSPTIR